MRMVRCEKPCVHHFVCRDCAHAYRHLAGEHADCLTGEHGCPKTPKRKCVPLKAHELTDSEKLRQAEKLGHMDGVLKFDAGRD